MDMENCDENGVCRPAPLESGHIEEAKPKAFEIIYIGDPMCSWCWGISNHLKRLQEYTSDHELGFDVILGGLRPGGGDPWDDQMKAFLKHHWEEVNKRSGQPFGDRLFRLEQFDYDTEPSCRAVVTAKHFLDTKGVMEFFEAVQRKFYVDNEDPKEDQFYASICEQFNIDFGYFKRLFHSTETAKATHEEFVTNRKWGVSGYPTLVLRHNEQLYLISNGYAEYELMVERIEALKLKIAEPAA